MQGYPLTEYENITCSGPYEQPYTIAMLDNMVPIENEKWSPIISISSSVVLHSLSPSFILFSAII